MQLQWGFHISLLVVACGTVTDPVESESLFVGGRELPASVLETSARKMMRRESRLAKDAKVKQNTISAMVNEIHSEESVQAKTLHHIGTKRSSSSGKTRQSLKKHNLHKLVQSKKMLGKASIQQQSQCAEPVKSRGCVSKGGDCSKVFLPGTNLCTGCVEGTPITLASFSSVGDTAEWCGQAPTLIVGFGLCQPASCDVKSESCRTNGFYKDGSSLDDCNFQCGANKRCLGFAIAAEDHSSAPGRCYIYTRSGGDSSGYSGWTADKTTSFDIATSTGDKGVQCYRKLVAEQGRCQEDGKRGGYCIRALQQLDRSSALDCLDLAVGMTSLAAVEHSKHDSQGHCLLAQSSSDTPTDCPAGFSAFPGGGDAITGYHGDSTPNTVCMTNPGAAVPEKKVISGEAVPEKKVNLVSTDGINGVLKDESGTNAVTVQTAKIPQEEGPPFAKSTGCASSGGDCTKVFFPDTQICSDYSESEGTRITLASFSSVSVKAEWCGQAPTLIVGFGLCRPAHCDPALDSCRINGFYKEGSSLSECNLRCDAMGECVGFAIAGPDHPSFPGRCYIYTNPGVDVLAGWTAEKASKFDIATSTGSSGAQCYRKLIAEQGKCHQDGQTAGYCEAHQQGTVLDCLDKAVGMTTLAAVEHSNFESQGRCRLAQSSPAAPSNCPAGFTGHPGETAVTDYHGDASPKIVCMTNLGSSRNAVVTDCLWMQWSEWSECDSSCGASSKARKRRISPDSRGPSSSCQGAFQESRDCDGALPCPSVTSEHSTEHMKEVFKHPKVHRVHRINHTVTAEQRSIEKMMVSEERDAMLASEGGFPLGAILLIVLWGTFLLVLIGLYLQDQNKQNEAKSVEGFGEENQSASHYGELHYTGVETSFSTPEELEDYESEMLDFELSKLGLTRQSIDMNTMAKTMLSNGKDELPAGEYPPRSAFPVKCKYRFGVYGGAKGGGPNGKKSSLCPKITCKRCGICLGTMLFMGLATFLIVWFVLLPWLVQGVIVGLDLMDLNLSPVSGSLVTSSLLANVHVQNPLGSFPALQVMQVNIVMDMLYDGEVVGKASTGDVKVANPPSISGLGEMQVAVPWMEIKMKDEGAALEKLAKDLIRKDNLTLSLEGSADTVAKMLGISVPLAGVPVKLPNDDGSVTAVSVAGMGGLKKVEIVSYSIPGSVPNGGAGCTSLCGILLTITANLENPSPVGLVVGTLNANIANMQGDVLGSVSTTGLALKPGTNEVRLDGKIKPAPDAIAATNVFFSNYMQNKPQQCKVIGTDAGDSPVKWLQNVMNGLTLQATFPGAGADFSVLTGVVVQTLGMDLFPDVNGTAVTPLVYATISARMQMPDGVDLSIITDCTAASMNMDMIDYDTGKTLGNLAINSSAVTINYTARTGMLKASFTATPMIVTDSAGFGILIKELLLGKNKTVQMTGTVSPTAVTNAGTLQLDGVPFSSSAILKGFNALMDPVQNTPLLQVNGLDITGGHDGSLNLVIDAQVTNPSNVAVSMGEVSLELWTWDGKTEFGAGVKLGDLTIDSFALTADLKGTSVTRFPSVAAKYTPPSETPEATAAGRLFLSNYVSGVSQQAIIKGSPNGTGTNIGYLKLALASLATKTVVPGLSSGLIKNVQLELPNIFKGLTNIPTDVQLVNPFSANLVFEHAHCNAYAPGDIGYFSPDSWSEVIPAKARHILQRHIMKLKIFTFSTIKTVFGAGTMGGHVKLNGEMRLSIGGVQITVDYNQGGVPVCLVYIFHNCAKWRAANQFF